MGIVKAVCISKKKGTQKRPVAVGNFMTDWGLEGDAHAGHWHRQISLLSLEKIEAFRQHGVQIAYGDFGENLVVSDIDFSALPVGTLLQCGEVLLEITQIGKECHQHCAIYQAVGDCIMPREGVFAKVCHDGIIRPGDTMKIIPRQEKRPYQAAVITLSDTGSRGERIDESGPVIVQTLQERGYDVVETILLPDGEDALKRQLIRLADQRQVDLILTTGGTGLGQRDVTPEATLAVATRLVPGIAEAMRSASLKITKRAMLSRAVSVIRGKTLIINLPGSPKACRECMAVFLDTIPHGMDLLRGDVSNCAAK